MQHFLTFQEITKAQLDPNLIGGKAHVLAQLYQNGFPVPDGFVITTEFFDSFSKENLQIEFSDEDAKKIYDCVDRCCPEGTVAVRSSASIEDSSNQSFAGQFDSFLNVKKDQVLETIKKCWRSLNSARAKSYAQNRNDIKMAVIVQKILIPEISGVAFSAHPVTGDRNSIIIEAVFGSSEPLVQGAITPDHYVMNKNFEILDKKTIPQNGVNRQKLSDFQLREVARLVVEASHFFNVEVDVEWAIESGKFYILQCRPITTIR